MAAPSISTYILSNSSHYYGSEGGAAVMTSPSDSVTKVSAIISQTSGGAAIETVDTTVKTSSDLYADRWALTWPTAGITASPYYVRMWATNSDGDGAVREVAPYIYFPPSVSVTSPADGSTLTDSSVTMAWSASDDYGISYQRASVSHDGTELWGAEVGGNSIAVPSSVVFEDGESYSFSVTARNGKGTESTATNTASFSFVAPSVPALVIAEGDGKSASITVTDSSYTESGTVLEASSSMMDALTIDGKSVQNGTPTPSDPVEIKSVGMENILDISNFPKATTTYLGCTITNNGDGTFTLSGTNTGSNAWDFSSTTGTQTLPAGTYTLSAGGTLEGCYLRVSIGGTWYQLMNNGYKTFTLDSPKNITQWIVTVYGSATISGTFRPTIVRGEHARLPDMPYGEDMLSVDSVSKNIADISTGNGITESGGVYTGTAANFNINYGAHGEIAVARDHFPQTLAVSLEAYTDGNVGTNGDGLLISAARDDGTLAKYVITIPNNTTSWATFAGNIDGFSDVKRIRISFSSNGGNVWHIRNLCIRLDGSTEYVPHSFTTTPIPVTLRSLPDGTHDEWISGETEDTLIQRVGVQVFDGSVYVPWVSGSGAYTRFGITFNGLAACTVMCEQLTERATLNLVAANAYSINGMTDNRLYISLSENETTVPDATAALAAHPITVYYKLATPVTTTLPHVTLPYVDGSAWVDAEVTPNIEATFRPVDFPDQPAADSVDVVRVNADGSTWTVASNLTMGDTVTDPLPPLGVDAVYKAVGKTSAGGMSEKLYMQEIPSTGWVLNFGDAAQETVGFIYNPQATMTLAQGGESYHFADGGMGGGFPVFYPTTDRDASGTLAFDTVLYGDSDRLLDLCRRYPVAWLRDPFGHRWRAHVRPSVSHGVGQVWPVTIAWDAVRFEEV